MSTLRDLFAPRSLVKLGLLLLAANALASGLTASLTGIRPGAFLAVALSAATIAWLLAFSRMRSADFYILLTTFGLLFVIVHAAQLWDEIGMLLSHLIEYQIDLIGVLFKRPMPDVAIVRDSIGTVVTGLSQMLQRVSTSIQAGTLDDLGVRELVWQIPILGLAGWAGWTLKKKNHALLALGPGMGVLAYVLYYTGTKPGSLQLMICVLLLLMGIIEWEKNTSHSTASAWLMKASSEVNLTLIILSVAITLAAGLIPSLSLKGAIDRIQETTGERRNQQITTALGLVDDPNALRRFAGVGLPTEHLVGAPPTTTRTIMFTVRTGELAPMRSDEMEAPAPNYYWRALTYDVYTSHGWETTLARTDSLPANEPLLEAIPAGYRTVHLEFDKKVEGDPRLYWTGTLLSSDQSFDMAWRSVPGSIPATEDPFTGADALGAITGPNQFEVDSVLPTASVEQLQAAPQEYPAFIRERYLGLPPTLPDRVRALAWEITDGITNPYEKAVALEAYLRMFPYSLEVPPPPQDEDVADYFLFTLQTGYCDYYATSMVVMARSVGLPARLVSGYSSGTYVPETAEYVVRGANAHSWPEIYFPGIGWVEFEPTANQPNIERPDSPEPTPDPITPSQAGTDEATGAEERFAWLQDVKLPVSTILFVMALAAAAAVYWGQTYRFAQADIMQIYSGIFRLGSKLTPFYGVSETPYMFAERLGRVLRQMPRPKFLNRWLDPAVAELEFLTGVYVRAMYSPRPVTEVEDARARHLWPKLFWRLWLARILKGKRSL
ncbi:MAG: transglutaminase domain-containing protein [Chloroflexota bacterium]